jgi:TonB family protein
MSDTWREWEGQVVDGAFSLRRHLGGSDHSVVFLTERGEGKTQKAAIKFVQADAANAELQLSRWKQAARLSHANLIKLFETGRCQLAGMDLLYVVMEYAEENLAQFLPQRALNPAETRDMLEPFLDTLTYLHGQGLVHGHIKPSNILALDDQLKLSSDTLCRIGESSAAAEKPDVYIAPEAATGAISAPRDIWSLGATLVEALTQRVPEQGQSAGQEDPTLPDTLPEPFLDIIRHCLRRDPQRRWTVAEISTRLNPPATPPAATVSTQTIPAPTKPAPAIAAPTIPAPTKSAPVAAAPTKPAASVDPLSVPLSQVPPLAAAKRQILENQTIARQGATTRSYYIVLGVLLALTLAATLAIPRLRSHHADTEPAASVAPNQSVAQPQPPPPVSTKPEPKLQSRSQQNPATPAVAPSAQRPAQDSLKTTSEKQPISKEQTPTATPPSSASLRSETPRSDAARSAPVPSASLPSDREAKVSSDRVAGGEVLNQVVPEISERARSTIRGTVRVLVKVHVDSSGSVTGANLASAPSRFFADAAVQAARRWDFAPPKVDGQNVASEWLLRFEFSQADAKAFPLQTSP